MSLSSEIGWSWFEKDLNEKDDPSLNEDLAGSFAKCFQGEEGEAVLSHLTKMTMSRALAGDVDAGVLRHLEGQRYLASYIMGLVRQGRAGN